MLPVEENYKVKLDIFEGPLDLLLYLIRRQNFNILDIPLAEVTRQYLVYVEEIRRHNLELASEYLLMAALLIDIKSRMLLPVLDHRGMEFHRIFHRVQSARHGKDSEFRRLQYCYLHGQARHRKCYWGQPNASSYAGNKRLAKRLCRSHVHGTAQNLCQKIERLTACGCSILQRRRS
jgi:hypothetical protein